MSRVESRGFFRDAKGAGWGLFVLLGILAACKERPVVDLPQKPGPLPSRDSAVTAGTPPTAATATTATTATTAATAGVVSSSPSTPTCAVAAGPLSSSKLQEAGRDLASRHLPTAWLKRLASSLGLSCVPSQPGFFRAVAGALAMFELRVLPFTTDVDGKLDGRTRRFLAMVYPVLRGRDHPCRHTGTPAPHLLDPARVQGAREKNGPRAGKTHAWVRALQRSLGAIRPSGQLDAPTIQRLAGWQRILHEVDPAVHARGVLDAATLKGLQRAFPRLANDAPDANGPEAFLPACVTEWKGADEEKRSFMMRVYETQRVWAAQRRRFSGWIDAAPIEEGCTAKRDAAAAAQRMLAAARADAGKLESRYHGGNLKVVFGYRSAATQVVLWEAHFPERYRSSASRRARLPGGPHGYAAVVLMARTYAARTAAPGYSLHNQGSALDLACVTPRGRTIGPTGRFLRAWEASWCLPWLIEHAASYGFHQNAAIHEPWHWEYGTGRGTD